MLDVKFGVSTLNNGCYLDVLTYQYGLIQSYIMSLRKNIYTLWSLPLFLMAVIHDFKQTKLTIVLFLLYGQYPLCTIIIVKQNEARMNWIGNKKAQNNDFSTTNKDEFQDIKWKKDSILLILTFFFYERFYKLSTKSLF